MDELQYNTENIFALSENISSTLSKFEAQIESMYSTFTTMGNSWSGDTYNSFKSYCDDYKTTQIDPLLETIKNWASQGNQIAEASQENTTKNVNLWG